MALSSHSLSLLISLSVAFLAIIPSSAKMSPKVTEEIVNKMCSNSDDKSYCFQFLHSIPETTTVDLHDLTQIVIDLAHNASQDNYGAFESQIEQTSDPELRKRYTACSVDFSSAMDSLLKAGISFKSGDFSDASKAAKDAGSDAKNCEDEFNEPPTLPSYLLLASQQFKTLCSIIEISIQLLQQKSAYLYTHNQ